MSHHCYGSYHPARRTLTALAVGASALISPLLTQVDAHADVPEPVSAAEHERELNAASAADEAYDAALAQAAELQRKIDGLQARMSSDARARDARQHTLGLQPALQYRGGSMSRLQLVLDDDPSAYLNAALTGNELTTENARTLRLLAEDEARLAADQALVQAELAQQQAAVTAARDRKNSADAVADRAREIPNAFGGAGQRAIAEAGHGVDPAHLTALAPNARAAAAVAYAESKVGDPYTYGAAGPGAFDCSGLTMAAWARAGVALPHNAAAQASMLPSVAVSQLEPGDLVFYSYDGGPIEHVAVYVGNGLVVHAPKPGENVQYGDVFDVGPIVRVGRADA